MQLSPTFHCNQTQVLVDIIVSHIRSRAICSLLDIGAGNGSVAVPISKEVRRYLAIEQEPDRCAALRAAGLDAINESFPVKLTERFDMVVSSHSIPEGDVTMYEPFLREAWRLVSPGGLLLIITFKGSEDSVVMRMSEELLHRKYQPDHRYTAMLQFLRSSGEVTITTRDSYIETADFSDVADLFGGWFWHSPEQEKQHRPLVAALVEARLGGSGRYKIPMPHGVIATSKPAV